jgi:hypothetical protein
MILVKTDAYNLVIVGILLQYADNDVLHPIAYFSRKHSPAEMDYEIYDKELLTIVRAIKEWHPLLEVSPNTIEVVSNHQNLTYFTSNLLLNYCQT